LKWASLPLSLSKSTSLLSTLSHPPKASLHSTNGSISEAVSWLIEQQTEQLSRTLLTDSKYSHSPSLDDSGSFVIEDEAKEQDFNGNKLNHEFQDTFSFRPLKFEEK